MHELRKTLEAHARANRETLLLRLGEKMFDSQKLIEKHIALLREQMQQQAALLNDLERSLAIEKLWPGAFDHGPVSSVISEPLMPTRSGIFRVRNGAGEERVFLLNDVPAILRNTD